MNLHEKIALMITVAALVVIAMVGALAGDKSLPEQTDPEITGQTESVGTPQISEYDDYSMEDAQIMQLPPFAGAENEEEFEFLPGRPGFLKPAFEPDPEVAAAPDESAADPAPAESEPPAAESSAQITTEITTAATTEAATTTATSTQTTPVTTTKPAPETTEKPATQKPVTTESKKPETTEPKPETTAKPVTTAKPEPKPTPETTDLRAAMIAMAKSQIGVAEEPYNNVKYNTWFYGHEVCEARKGATKYAWCVVFLSWCADQSGIPHSVFPKIGSVSGLKNFFADQGRYYSSSEYTPKAGDIVFFKSSHAGIVVSVDGGKITVVEGNYSDKVSKTTYDIGSSKLKGYGSPKY